jgi:hypothetical protein
MCCIRYLSSRFRRVPRILLFLYIVQNAAARKDYFSVVIILYTVVYNIRIRSFPRHSYFLWLLCCMLALNRIGTVYVLWRLRIPWCMRVVKYMRRDHIVAQYKCAVPKRRLFYSFHEYLDKILWFKKRSSGLRREARIRLKLWYFQQWCLVQVNPELIKRIN